MVNLEAINKGIAAHSAWKARLRTAVSSGKFDVPAATVAKDNQCEFGKWLYGLSGTDQLTEKFSTVRRLHTQFHEEAARIVTLATSGQSEKAEQAMALGGSYTKASAELTGAMVRWRNSL